MGWIATSRGSVRAVTFDLKEVHRHIVHADNERRLRSLRFHDLDIVERGSPRRAEHTDSHNRFVGFLGHSNFA